MNKKRVYPSKTIGTVKAPPSKSITQRALVMEMLADGVSVINKPSLCNDSINALNLISDLGVKKKLYEDSLILESNESIKKNKNFELTCGESGLLIRIISPVLSLYSNRFILKGTGSLNRRPVGMIEKTLIKLGASVKSRNGYPPLEITGPISGKNFTVDGSITSQFISGLLMALPICSEDSVLEAKNLKSRPYIDITLNMLKNAGIIIGEDKRKDIFLINGKQIYNPLNITIEGDWSSASFLLVAGAVAGDVTVENLSKTSLQADKAILEVLKLAGAKIITGDNYISVKKRKLSSFEFDISESPDLFPPIAALAAFCDGTSTVLGTGRLKYKESNRTESIKKEFNSLGIIVNIFNDKVEIQGDSIIGGKTVSSHDDHRIAMALTLMGLGASDVIEIEGWKSISKSYKNFFNDMVILGAEIE